MRERIYESMRERRGSIDKERGDGRDRTRYGGREREDMCLSNVTPFMIWVSFYSNNVHLTLFLDFILLSRNSTNIYKYSLNS